MQNGTINRELARDRVYEYVRKQHSGQLREKGGHACVYVCIHACMHACICTERKQRHLNTRLGGREKNAPLSAGHSLPLSFSTEVLFPHNRACFLSRTTPSLPSPPAPYINWKGSSYPLPTPSLPPHAGDGELVVERGKERRMNFLARLKLKEELSPSWSGQNVLITHSTKARGWNGRRGEGGGESVWEKGEKRQRAGAGFAAARKNKELNWEKG